MTKKAPPATATPARTGRRVLLLAWADSYWPVALYVMAAALISFVSVYLATESFREELTEELAREPGATASGAGQTT
jgi:hypothetical protein